MSGRAERVAVVVAPTMQRYDDWCRERGTNPRDRRAVVLTSVESCRRLRGLRADQAELTILGWPETHEAYESIRRDLRICGFTWDEDRNA